MKKKSKPKSQKNNILKFRHSPEIDALKQRQQDLEQARVTYERWKEDFINHRKSPDQIPEALNQLAATLERQIKTPDVREYVVKVLIDPLIARSHMAAMQMLDTVEVVIDCPHKIKVNNVQSDCGWGGVGRPSKRQWASKTTTMNCPQCGSLLTQENMALKSDVEAMLKKARKK